MASNAGLTDAEIQAATSDGPVSGVASDYVLICAATDELLGTGTLTDETLSTLLGTFGQVVTRKYIVTISWFSMLSLFLNATRTPDRAGFPFRVNSAANKLPNSHGNIPGRGAGRTTRTKRARTRPTR
jgi:hypothetical protein